MGDDAETDGFIVEDMTIEADGTRVINKIHLTGPMLLQFRQHQPDKNTINLTPRIVTVNETPLLELGGRPVAWFERWLQEKEDA